MAKKFQLSASRLHDLNLFLGSVTPAELTDSVPNEPMKAISRLPKIIDESIEPADKALVDYFKSEVDPKSEEVLKPINVKLMAIKDDPALSEEQKNAARAPFLSEANKALAELRKSLGVEEHENLQVDVVVSSDEKFELVKVLFEKLGAKKFQSIRAMAEIKDAFDGAKEV